MSRFEPNRFNIEKRKKGANVGRQRRLLEKVRGIMITNKQIKNKTGIRQSSLVHILG